MYSKYVLTLPGGFELPVALLRETLIDCNLYEEFSKEQNAYQFLSNFASDYTRKRMIAGQILVADEITPDTARFWDAGTHEPLDIDRFRRDMDNVAEAYQEVLHRMMGVS